MRVREFWRARLWRNSGCVSLLFGVVYITDVDGCAVRGASGETREQAHKGALDVEKKNDYKVATFSVAEKKLTSRGLEKRIRPTSRNSEAAIRLDADYCTCDCVSLFLRFEGVPLLSGGVGVSTQMYAVGRC